MEENVDVALMCSMHVCVWTFSSKSDLGLQYHEFSS